MSVATVRDLSAALALDREAAPAAAPLRVLLLSVVLVVLVSFAFTGAALALLTPSGAVAAAVVSALFTGVVSGAFVRDGRVGVLFGSVQMVFAGAVITFGPAIVAAVHRG